MLGKLIFLIQRTFFCFFLPKRRPWQGLSLWVSVLGWVLALGGGPMAQGQGTTPFVGPVPGANDYPFPRESLIPEALFSTRSLVLLGLPDKAGYDEAMEKSFSDHLQLSFQRLGIDVAAYISQRMCFMNRFSAQYYTQLFHDRGINQLIFIDVLASKSPLANTLSVEERLARLEAHALVLRVLPLSPKRDELVAANAHCWELPLANASALYEDIFALYTSAGYAHSNWLINEKSEWLPPYKRGRVQRRQEVPERLSLFLLDVHLRCRFCLPSLDSAIARENAELIRWFEDHYPFRYRFVYPGKESAPPADYALNIIYGSRESVLTWMGKVQRRPRRGRQGRGQASPFIYAAYIRQALTGEFLLLPFQSDKLADVLAPLAALKK